MNKKVLLKDLVESGRHIRTQVTPKARVSDEGIYPIGEFWDANTTVDVIVNGATTALDTLKETEQKLNQVDIELAKKQEKLVSGTNIKTISGQSILGDGNIDIQSTVLANEQMPDSWDKDHTMHNLIESINADENAVPGKIYLSTVNLSDLPAGMMQAEVKVEIMGQQSGKKILLFSITSADRSPYRWEYTAYNMSEGPWRSWMPYQDMSNIIARIEALEQSINTNPEV